MEKNILQLQEPSLKQNFLLRTDEDLIALQAETEFLNNR